MSEKRSERSLWDIAIDISNEIKKSENGEKVSNQQSEESSILIIGSKKSGKSTIVLRFLDKDENPKPTVALDYTFGRRGKGHNMQRDIGHIWELGGGAFLSKLTQIPLKAATISSTSVLLVVDLSKPNELWHTIEVLLKTTRATVDKMLTDLKTANSSLVQQIQDEAWKRFGENHADKSFLNPFPIPLGIVGTKYDIYQDFDPEKRKMISRTLRFIAHSNGAHLQYFSSKAEGLITRTRTLFGSLLFRAAASKVVSTDHNKPIIVPAGQDSFANIGAPPVSTEDLAKLTGRRPYDLWKAAYASVFPPENPQETLKNEDITHNPQYSEAAIDSMRAQKDEELERYKRQAERNAAHGKTTQPRE
ncbi:cytoplasmic dynein 2 light intermediate chain 1-like [Dendronephthya gigantea]|uniref:cytoplasmic dynein 2 light intermediate chain 1-like n=1 Tax=Dendronephthya gigantea TaxID=151771 RepID=UPI00106CF1D4|nr:cytoplasmic dynein 2 light intermediate chain 1-like [Dendronephthya gigantea]